jgi:Holliday junction resolvase-like predicted endonuclease
VLFRRSVTFPIWPDPPFDPSWTSDQKGWWAERVVARRLWQDGWQIRAHRWVAPSGTDLDLVAANDRQYLFIECKLRSMGDENPWREINDPKRRRRFINAIGAYLRASNQRMAEFSASAFLVIPAPGKAPTVDRLDDFVLQTSVPGWIGVPKMKEG